MKTQHHKYLALIVLASSMTAFADDRVNALPEDDPARLEEEAVCIISDAEWDVFLELKTKEEPDEHAIRVLGRDLTLEANDEETEFFTTLQVSLELRNEEGQLLAVTEDQPFLQLTLSDFELPKGHPFAYCDSAPVLPGEYHVSVILRNRATKLEDVLSASPDEHKTFQLGTLEIDPVTDDAFTPGSTAYVVRKSGAPGLRGSVRFSLMSGETTVLSEPGRSSNEAHGAVTAALPLLQVEPGEYTIRAELRDESGAVLGSRSKPVTISPRTSIPRAGFVYRHSFSAAEPGLLDMTLGEQLMVEGRIEEAEARLRKAVAYGNPRLTMAKWKLASAVLFKRNAGAAPSARGGAPEPGRGAWLLVLHQGRPQKGRLLPGAGHGVETARHVLAQRSRGLLPVAFEQREGAGDVRALP